VVRQYVLDFGEIGSASRDPSQIRDASFDGRDGVEWRLAISAAGERDLEGPLSL
jgi:hypothetical protein